MEKDLVAPKLAVKDPWLLLHHADLEKRTWRGENAMYYDAYYVPPVPFVNPELWDFTMVKLVCLYIYIVVYYIEDFSHVELL